ncbi:MAG TPA: helix-turn-helix domain-containing protein [Stellaceae bacterium]|nr:helix-turn-helix domain-containing protein [Stellaceae bacterium]
MSDDAGQPGLFLRQPTPDPILTLAEVAARYRFTERWLRDFIRAKHLPVLHTGRQIRFDAVALNALDQALRRPAKPAAAEISAVALSSLARSAFPRGRGSAYERALSLLASITTPKRSAKSRRSTRG